MPLNLSPEDFRRLVNILAGRPGFTNPMSRVAFVTAMFQPSPRAPSLLSRLPMNMVNAQSDAVSLVHYLLQFGQDVLGREAVTLVIRALLEDMGEGEDRDFLVGLFEKYALEDASTGKPMTILFMTANPTETARLRLDVEQREIDDALRMSRYRDRFKLETRPALRASDLQEALLRYRPGIVHFSGHGGPEGLAFEEDNGELRLMPSEEVAELFSLIEPKVQVVVLNACYSASQAALLTPHVRCVVGMALSIGDAAAIQFSKAFYRALCYGLNLQTAFDLGGNQIGLMGLRGTKTPVLLCNDACDPAKVKLI